MTQIHKLPPHPPLLLTELDEVVETLSAKMPELMRLWSNQLGVTVLPNAVDRAKFRRNMKRLAERLRPFALVEMLATDRITVTEFNSALQEGMVRAYLEANGKRIPAAKHSMVYLVELSEKLMPRDRALRRNKDYVALTQTVNNFVDWVLSNGTTEQIENFFRELAESPEITKHWQFIMQLDTLQKRWCHSAPRRFSWGVVHRLTNEFRDWAPFVESRLKIFVGMYRSLAKTGGWADVEHQTLNNLQHMARAAQPLAPIADAINRNVRNALAHGLPAVDPRTKVCRFVDRTVEVKWSLSDLFDQTRNLRRTALALGSFEATLIGARTRREVQQSFEAYWTALKP